jgi:hypothetical protein
MQELRTVRSRQPPQETDMKYTSNPRILLARVRRARRSTVAKLGDGKDANRIQGTERAKARSGLTARERVTTDIRLMTSTGFDSNTLAVY